MYKRQREAITVQLHGFLDASERGPVSYTHLDVYKRQKLTRVVEFALIAEENSTNTLLS